MTKTRIILYRMHSVKGTMLGYFKVFGELFFTAEDTAKILPADVYECEIEYGLKSNKSAGFNYAYRIFEDIPDRDSFVFMHVGNTHGDVDGCIGGGLIANTVTGAVEQSVNGIQKFYNLMNTKTRMGPIQLVILDPEKI